MYAAIEDATMTGDAATVESVGKVWREFTDSALVKSLLSKAKEVVEDSKKKVAGKKLKSSPSEY